MRGRAFDFEGVGGGGVVYGRFGLGNNFFISLPLETEFFPWHIKPLYNRYFPARSFFSFEISLQDIFPEITQLPPSKVKDSAPKEGEVQVTID